MRIEKWKKLPPKVQYILTSIMFYFQSLDRYYVKIFKHFHLFSQKIGTKIYHVHRIKNHR